MPVRIPVYAPSLDGNEREYVLQCLETVWISSKGEFIERFENAFGDFLGGAFCTSVTNGTVALHVALEALGITEGDEVIVPTLTYVASVNTIAQTGATPVFADSVPSTWQLDPADVRCKITSRTKAIMVVHLYGHPCDMAALKALAEEYGLFLIEDCAEALGAYFGDRHVGLFGDIATFSFYGNKTITTGEGGMVVSRSRAVIDRAKRLKNQGVSSDRQYWHDIIGYNYRMTNICAAIGLAQLEQVDQFIAQKRRVAFHYQDELRRLPLAFHSESLGTTHSFWMCSILVDEPEMRDQLRKYLADREIETRPVFYPIHIMPVFRRQEQYPVAESIGKRGINLPSWPGLSAELLDEICTSIRSFFRSAYTS
jgi:perosamine synthetase